MRYCIIFACIIFVVSLVGCDSDTIKDRDSQIRGLHTENAQLKDQIIALHDEIKLRSTPETNLADQLVELRKSSEAELARQGEFYKKQLQDKTDQYEKQLQDRAVQIDTLGSRMVVPELSELQRFIQETRQRSSQLETEIGRAHTECVQLRAQIKDVENKRSCRCGR